MAEVDLLNWPQRQAERSDGVPEAHEPDRRLRRHQVARIGMTNALAEQGVGQIQRECRAPGEPDDFDIPVAVHPGVTHVSIEPIDPRVSADAERASEQLAEETEL